ncbi:MAG: 2,5-diketo-D-gluconic acid reductase [Tenericutes bacterium HGW-Tenericutes-4]|nr:MAG: 2,5-diketo-D-gluconic acid reductase [Tenericutes bacterium HGW-Tenericutes-4]
MKVLNSFFVLSNGVKIPKLGFGTWQINPGEDAYNAVSMALANGYRHIDTAEGYKNESSVGKAIKDSGLRREEVFITSKLESHIKTYEGAKKAFAKTLKALGTDYLDLFIIHAPWPWNEMGKNCDEGNVQAYKAMEELYMLGKIRAIGVSNFEIEHLENIIKNCDIVPHVNQIGHFIGIDHKDLIEYCEEKEIFIIAYSPLGIGYLLSNEIIKEVANKYEVSPAQICIRYLLQKGMAPIPKSVHEERIIQNSEVDFVIEDCDMGVLDKIKGDPRRWGE